MSRLSLTELPELDFIFCTHHHGDHLDGPTLEGLLPVNGRRRELSERNIAGNFSLREAIELCGSARVPVMMAHHFGMFAFNTVEPVSSERLSAHERLCPRCPEWHWLNSNEGT